MSRAEELLRGREALIAQCETQRAELALHVGALGTPIRIADRIEDGIRGARITQRRAEESLTKLMVRVGKR